MEKDIYNSAEYKRSRAAYSWQCAFEYWVAIVAGDAFLAKLLTEMGIKDSTIGIISSFISAAFLFQLASLVLMRYIKNVKKTATAFNVLSALLFMCLYLLPFAPIGEGSRTGIVMAVILAAYFCNYAVTSVIFKWGNSFVDPTKRGTYSAGKEMLSLVTGVIFSLFVGQVFDRFENSGNIQGGFIFMAVSIFIISLLTLISLLLIKGEKKEEKTNAPLFKEVVKNTFGNKNFRRVLTMESAWKFANYLTLGFLGVYKTKELMLTVGAVQIINMTGSISRFALSMPFGKFTNKYGFARGLELGYTLVAAGFLANVFCTPNAWWLIVVYAVLYNVGLAGISQNSLNIMYNCVKDEYFVQASAIKGSVSGIIGFAGSIVGGNILDAVQKNGNAVFGIPMYGQQFMSAITFVILAAVIVYVHFVVAKQKAMVR